MKLVLLDRDGVINVDRSDSVKSKAEFSLLPGVLTAIRLLNSASIPVAIVSNQAVVGRGELSLSGLEKIHDHMKDLLNKGNAFIDEIFVCTSTDENDLRRKPNPGLLLEALKMFHVKHFDAVMIGDALRDLKAAAAIDCPRVLVRTGKGVQTIENGLPDSLLPVAIFDDLLDAVTHLMEERKC